MNKNPNPQTDMHNRPIPKASVPGTLGDIKSDPNILSSEDTGKVGTGRQ